MAESKMNLGKFNKLVQSNKLIHVKDQQIEIKFAQTETITETSNIVYITRYVQGYIVSEFKYREDDKNARFKN